MTGPRRVCAACIGLQSPETQACAVTGYSHLRWRDNCNDGQFNFLYNIINRSCFGRKEKGMTVEALKKQ